MDLAKYLSLLERKSLYFVRLDQLSDFDPFEGYYTNLNLEFEKINFDEMPDEWKEASGIKDKKIFEAVVKMEKSTRELVKYHRTITYVNSWHLKEHESAAMWKVYLSNREGIAVQSSLERLIGSMVAYDEFDIHIGKMKYIDFDKEIIPMRNLLTPYIYKRKSFEYEDELRALIWTPQHGKNDMINSKNNRFKDTFGIYVPVNISQLIENVYVSPNAPNWVLEIIEKVSAKYELNNRVTRSDLASTPIY